VDKIGVDVKVEEADNNAATTTITIAGTTRIRTAPKITAVIIRIRAAATIKANTNRIRGVA